jgi:hypothetical protein
MKRIQEIGIKVIPTSEKVGYAKRQSDALFDTSTIFPSSKKGLDLLTEAERCYDSLYLFRKQRERNRKYYRGDQWGDWVTVNGHRMTEREYIEMQGKPALKQNLIRPQVKNVLGQFRSNPFKSTIVARNRADQMASEMMNVALESAYAMNDGKERDARMLEEFLISGAGIYITSYSFDSDRQRPIPKFRAIDINRFFQTPNSTDLCGEDIDFIGDFMDLPIDEVISLYSGGSKEKAKRIREIYADYTPYKYDADQQLSKQNNNNLSFGVNANNGLCRVFRICKLEARWMLEVHDYLDASYEIRDIGDEVLIQAENIARQQMAMEQGVDVPLIEYERKYVRLWKYYHVSPYGNIFYEAENPYEHKNHPYIVKFYPMLDGEAWSMVNDMIDQQKMINRMIILYDFIVSASAKGVLLVPEDSIPDDMDIEDFADEWTRYNGVIKIKAKPGVQLPQQISTNMVNIGLTDMINMQVKFMQDIGGVHGAIQGKAPSSGTPSSLYQQEAMNAQLNILDYIESYMMFLQKRDFKLVQVIKQYYTEPQYIALAGKSYSEEARNYDPDRIRNIDFDNAISKSNDTASFRMIVDDLLKELLMNNFISLEMYLEHASFPFADKILQSVRAQREQMAQTGQMPSQQDMAQIAQMAQDNVPQNEQGMQQANKLTRGFNPNAA